MIANKKSYHIRSLNAMSRHVMNIRTNEHKIRINHTDELNIMETNGEKYKWGNVRLVS